MKFKNLKFLLILLCSSYINSQNYYSKEFSKDESLFKVKTFLIKEILGSSEEVKQFEAEPLAASDSGELTTLLYKSDSENIEGMILGFYGNYWDTNSGVTYQGYGFKNFTKEKAIDFLDLIDKTIKTQQDFLRKNYDNNNVLVKYDDIDILIYKSNSGGYDIRLYWQNFDSIWEGIAYNRSKRRFEKKLND